MVQTKQRFASFEEYLNYDDGSDKLYELYNGELIEMPPESGMNVQIANRLFLVFALLIGIDRVRGNGLELEVRGEPRNRFPDLTILREEHIKLLANRNTIRLSMSPPLLVVEVVSPGELQRDRDFVAKRLQYQDCGIPEYWIIDPENQSILVVELVNQIYEEMGIFTGNDLVVSRQFPSLNLPTSQIFDVENG
ncbi:Uma2 family endonuclease [Sphaerospermopsis sp. LEGE 08334]|jgi:Uma2 family endonuclease|uniref:Uma2 family endonuclease n=1 Tax=Sphaerospermopsis sp. LEGE 08334 TaxID=1828651 RepID=UPI00187FE01D|nr:Uma2 family endonuclease [Sphaerospermopsis sp. LEGE 08334]MBE9058261.1 Uma2 family endonuclease [Sphaerospermopsis sp. LEGE 08334]